jgi:hypothetical protein
VTLPGMSRLGGAPSRAVEQEREPPETIAGAEKTGRMNCSIDSRSDLKLTGQAVEGGGRRALTAQSARCARRYRPTGAGLRRVHDHHPPQDLEALIRRRRIGARAARSLETLTGSITHRDGVDQIRLSSIS